MEHKVAWSKYEIELAVDRYAVDTIVSNVDKQYIVVKCMDYIGHANETAQTMITELRTHHVVLNAEKWKILSFFMALWSESPYMTLKEYSRQLDKRQRGTKNQGVTIYEEDMITHFVVCAEDSGLFKEEWVTEWETTSDRSCNLGRDVWVGNWLEITQAATMAAKRGGYESAAALRMTRETPPPIPALGTVTRAEYDAVSEYAYALEEENTELKSGGGNDVLTVSTLEAASSVTETTTRILAKMRTVHAAQMP